MGWTGGCFLHHCDDCHQTQFALPRTAVEATNLVTVEFRSPAGADPMLVCQSVTTKPFQGGTWMCGDPGGELSEDDQFWRPNPHPADPWFVRLTGPSGTQNFMRNPTDLDSGEGWPTSCFCDSFRIAITNDDLAAVGAKPEI